MVIEGVEQVYAVQTRCHSNSAQQHLITLFKFQRNDENENYDFTIIAIRGRQNDSRFVHWGNLDTLLIEFHYSEPKIAISVLSAI